MDEQPLTIFIIFSDDKNHIISVGKTTNATI